MKISQVSGQSGLPVDTLRYYEKVGLLPPVNRTNGGIRDYNELDVRRVDFIKYMRPDGLPIETLIEFFALVQQGDETIQARKEILQAQRAQLMARMADLQENLAVCRRTPFCRPGILTSPLGNAVRNRGYSDFPNRLLDPPIWVKQLFPFV